MNKPQEVGICPSCQEEELVYGGEVFIDSLVYYPWKCENCGELGREFYDVIFAEHTLIDSQNCKFSSDNQP